ncbi:MAG: MBL fold metallo-hydrolase [Bdellovibrionales bacterium]|nr:MBL fold metallo-hydrolase [Bdellovibrionales bacterium]
MTMSNPLDSTTGVLGLKQIRVASCLGYLLWDKATSQALAIDPPAEAQGEFRELLQSGGLRLSVIIETHTRPDLLFCSQSLKRETGSKILRGRATLSSDADQLVSDQEKICFGSLELEALETPGHTPDSICLIFQDPKTQERLAFTGETLMMGSTGRTDLPSAHSSLLFDSLRKIESMLSPETLILPSHDKSDLLFSSLQMEQKLNPQLLEKDRQKFIDQKREESLVSRGALRREVQRVPSTTVQKYALKLDARAAGELFVDVREPDEFMLGHIPGVESIPISELALQWNRLRGAKKIYLSCQSGRRSEMVARTLDRLGIAGVVNVTGGFQAWSKAGLAVEKPRG